MIWYVSNLTSKYHCSTQYDSLKSPPILGNELRTDKVSSSYKQTRDGRRRTCHKRRGGVYKCITIPTYTHPSNSHSPPAVNLNYHSNTPRALLDRQSI